jgi:two-component system, cell cycle sensor histidine kinase and response regulator CckA
MRPTELTTGNGGAPASQAPCGVPAPAWMAESRLAGLTPDAIFLCAHDLHNILAPVLWLVPMLRANPRGANFSSSLEIIEASIQHAERVVKQVLCLGQAESQERTVMQPRDLLLDLARVVGETFPRNIRVQTSIPELWPVTANATQIYRVLMNLCVNARDAMPGGGLLMIKGANRRVEAQHVLKNDHARPGCYVRLEVADTGSGIPPDVRARIFEPFFTTKKNGQGTGLGLAIVSRVVSRHGGFLTLDSEMGRGSIFAVHLPAAKN